MISSLGLPTDDPTFVNLYKNSHTIRSSPLRNHGKILIVESLASPIRTLPEFFYAHIPAEMYNSIKQDNKSKEAAKKFQSQNALGSRYVIPQMRPGAAMNESQPKHARSNSLGSVYVPPYRRSEHASPGAAMKDKSQPKHARSKSLGSIFVPPHLQSEYASPGAAMIEGFQSHNIIPVSIDHILSFAEEPMMIGRQEVHMITIVGVVTALEEGATKIVFQVDDMTGPPIEVNLPTGNYDQGSANRTPFSENTYVRVIGNIRSCSKGKKIIASRVLPLSSNELSIHMLEVQMTRMEVSIEPKKDDKDMSMDYQHNVADTSKGFDNAVSVIMAGMTKPQKLVYQSILSCKSEQGISIENLVKNLKTLNRHDISDVIEYLSNEGHIFSTIDEDHYSATAC